MPQHAYKYTGTINLQGKVEVAVPLPPGTPVEILVLSPDDDLTDLVAASATRMEFWDHPLDDEDWNNA